MLTCAGCKSTDIETDHARGNSICKRCGMVVEDSLITSEVTFMESSSGANSVLGQYVNAEGTKPYAAMTSSGYPQFSRDSRTLTLQTGRKSIQQLAPTLALTSRHVEMATRYFRMAMEYRFIQGRKTDHVVAACLYIVVRLEKLPLMLLDFADALQVNVFTLGATYLKLCETLKIHKTFKDAMPIIDPVLYLDRFAHKLEFGPKTQEVYQTAVRLVSRMNRDWIQVGRRPAGLCGAGLLIAARLHGFSRTQKEIVNVVRICESTLRKRLEEFEDTRSSTLTLQEFKTINLETEADPPAFTQARQRARLAIKDAAAAAAAASASNQQHQLQQQQQDDAEVADGAADSSEAAAAASGPVIDEAVEAAMRSMAESELFRALDEDVNQDQAAASGDGAAAAAAASGEQPLSGRQPKTGPAPRHLGGYVISGTWEQPEGDGNLSELDDEELETEFLMAPHEIKAKEKVWMAENKSYLEKQAQKEAQLERERAAGIVKSAPKKRKRKLGRPTEPANTAEEAMQQMLEYKKSRISSKINYDVLKGLGLPTEDDNEQDENGAAAAAGGSKEAGDADMDADAAAAAAMELEADQAGTGAGSAQDTSSASQKRRRIVAEEDVAGANADGDADADADADANDDEPNTDAIAGKSLGLFARKQQQQQEEVEEDDTMQDAAAQLGISRYKAGAEDDDYEDDLVEDFDDDDY